MKVFLFFLFSTVLYVSCGGYKTGVVEKESSGYLKFIGDTSNVVIKIDDLAEFSLTPETDLYKIAPGQYTISVFRGDALLIKRIVIIQATNTFELEIP
jgi:hypothetical protein